ncbi:hypothetical protein PCYB_072940 [Plasmodium cynomolgi strain B]|uniref:Brix domain-containing protein n=1 Tax=Plasmodium cynomolgi (strain B) TaxID=1120755 RepID=K6V9E2_PLACD|nr:hypothetical protein PCYB_072940 [Plasmodium cynomolgi strain B]GAB65792.1 hypothetical protein PCYB_072940 [Plasmodium cynomolgi strain B]
MKELSITFPHIFYEPRLDHSIEFLMSNSVQNNFSTFILIEEGIDKHPKYMFISTLPNGPTAKYSLTNVLYAHKKKTDIEITTLPPEKCALNEIGPAFTLQLLSLKDGLINDKEKMYEFVLRPDMKVNRKKMYL